MPLLRETYPSLFDRALAESLGIVIDVTNAPRFQISLCEWRKNFGKPEYSDILVCVPSTPDQVFLVKKSVELE